jgi:hypothetical protein
MLLQTSSGPRSKSINQWTTPEHHFINVQSTAPTTPRTFSTIRDERTPDRAGSAWIAGDSSTNPEVRRKLVLAPASQLKEVEPEPSQGVAGASSQPTELRSVRYVGVTGTQLFHCRPDRLNSRGMGEMVEESTR